MRSAPAREPRKGGSVPRQATGSPAAALAPTGQVPGSEKSATKHPLELRLSEPPPATALRPSMHRELRQQDACIEALRCSPGCTTSYNLQTARLPATRDLACLFRYPL